MFLIMTSSDDLRFNLLAKGCHRTYPVKIPNKVATKAAAMECPSFSVSSKFPSAPIKPTTAPRTPNVGAYIPA